jgi:O-antigen biosynthesis protein
VREADACSLALLATPRAIFAESGGFDEEYRPAYYADVDYCFGLRQRGYRVYYQPESVAVRTEASAAGTDLPRDVKRYQAVNQAKFVRKWGDALAQQPPRPLELDRRSWTALAVSP